MICTHIIKRRRNNQGGKTLENAGSHTPLNRHWNGNQFSFLSCLKISNKTADTEQSKKPLQMSFVTVFSHYQTHIYNYVLHVQLQQFESTHIAIACRRRYYRITGTIPWIIAVKPENQLNPLFPTTPEGSCTARSACMVTPIASHCVKQVGVAAWLKCWLSHLGVAGSSPGHENL